MSARERQAALDRVSRICGRTGDLVALWAGITDVLADAVPFDWPPCYYTLDPASLLVTSHFHHGLAEFPTEWLVQEYDGQDVHTLADVAASPTGVSTLHDVTGRSPEHTRRWQQNIRLGGDQELIARLQTRSGETWGALGLYREPDRPLFDAEDRAFLRAASPALADGVRRALLLEEATDPEWPDAPGLVILGTDLDIDSLSPGAERWLDELGDGGTGPLPTSVQSVVAAAAGAARAEVSMARVLSRRGAWVVLHGAPLQGDDTGRVAVIIEPANPDRILPLLMSVYGLTERERQVVGLVLKGLPTAGIASRLFVSTYTVQQHLTSIFDKVGVRSRGDLVARLFFTRYEPRFRDNEHRTAASRPLRGGPAATDQDAVAPR